MSDESLDPCGEVGPNQRWAYVWFLAVLVVGMSMTVILARIDRMNYDSDGKYLDYVQYRENRIASTSIASERVDPRTNSTLATQVKRLEK